MRHSRHHRQHKHNPGSGVEHRRACQQLVAHVMGDIAVVADAGDDNRRRRGAAGRHCATRPSPMVISTYCWKAASALRLYLKIPIQTARLIRSIARIIIPAHARPAHKLRCPVHRAVEIGLADKSSRVCACAWLINPALKLPIAIGLPGIDLR